MKICSKCKIEKELTEFNKRLNRLSGVTSRCKECLSSDANKLYKRDSHKVREYGLKKSYGIGHEEYNELLELQDSKCAICTSEVTPNKTKKHLCVDHNHDTGQVRGLLCDSCNRALGLFKDDINVLQSAINYISKSLTQTSNDKH